MIGASQWRVPTNTSAWRTSRQGNYRESGDTRDASKASKGFIMKKVEINSGLPILNTMLGEVIPWLAEFKEENKRTATPAEVVAAKPRVFPANSVRSGKPILDAKGKPISAKARVARVLTPLCNKLRAENPNALKGADAYRPYVWKLAGALGINPDGRTDELESLDTAAISALDALDIE